MSVHTSNAQKAAYAGSQSVAFERATQDLEALAERKVSRERVQRWTKRVGNKRVAEVEQQAEQYQSLTLPERRKSPTDQVPPVVVPQVACVMADGGRIRICKRKDPLQDQNEQSRGHCRESLVGCCLSMTSDEHAADPCPTIPKTFVDPRRMGDLSREIKGFSGRLQAGTANHLQPHQIDD